jgi:hypothetical protein
MRNKWETVARKYSPPIIILLFDEKEENWILRKLLLIDFLKKRQDLGNEKTINELISKKHQSIHSIDFSYFS